MTASFIFDGLTFTDTDFSGYGFHDNVTVRGSAYPRFMAMPVAVMYDVNDVLTDATTQANYAANVGGSGIAFRLTFDASTSDSDPGTGKLRANNATLASSTVLYINNADIDGTSITALIDTLADSTNPLKGHIGLRHRTNGAVWGVWALTAITAASGYYKLSVTWVGGPGGFVNGDAIAFCFVRTGDKGNTGATGAGSTINGMNQGVLVTGGARSKINTISGQSVTLVASDNVGGDRIDLTVALAGDSASPGNSKYYGTDGSGSKGFFTVTPGGFQYSAASIAVNGGMYLFNTSAGALTATLPAAPTTGTAITFADASGTWGTYALTLARNGQTINGVAADLICNLSGATFTLWFNGSDWRIS